MSVTCQDTVRRVETDPAQKALAKGEVLRADSLEMKLTGVSTSEDIVDVAHVSRGGFRSRTGSRGGRTVGSGRRTHEVEFLVIGG
jgi:ribosomal protein L34